MGFQFFGVIFGYDQDKSAAQLVYRKKVIKRGLIMSILYFHEREASANKFLWDKKLFERSRRRSELVLSGLFWLLFVTTKSNKEKKAALCHSK